MIKTMACALMLVTPGFAAAANPPGPEILKVEPPGWWVGHSLSPVRLMIRGRNLAGARIESTEPALELGAPTVNPAGTYLFVDVKISPQAKPGRRRLKIVTAAGQAAAPLEILAPLARSGRFSGFSPDDVVYLIMPDRFSDGDPSNDRLVDRKKSRYYHGGDLQGVINHLPYLKDLGVTAVWLTPVYANTPELYPIPTWSPEHYTDYHGYGAVDLYAVDGHLGDVPKLRELTDRAHALGIKVILDQVTNHTGPRHPWAQDPPTPTWYNGTSDNHLDCVFQNWVLADPHATPQLVRPTMDGWYFSVLPDFNHRDPEVARYLTQNTLWWMGVAGLDGLREDTFYFAPQSFWKDCLAALKREYPSTKVVGEIYGSDPALVSYFQGGKKGFDGIDTGLDSVFDLPLMKTVREVFVEGKPVEELAISLSHDHLYPNPDVLMTLLGSHDEIRFMSLPGATAQGLKQAFAFLMTTRGMPLIYYGDEIAMKGGKDPDNRRDFPGGWSGDPRSAFSSAGRTAEEESVFKYVRGLARLRAELEPLRRGRLYNLAVGEKTYAYARVSGRSWAIVVLNNGDKPETLEFETAPVSLSAGAELKDRLGSPSQAHADGKKIKVQIAARSTVLYAGSDH